MRHGSVGRVLSPAAFDAVRSASAPFTPASLAPAIWLDASNPASVTQTADDDAIEPWYGLGNGTDDFTQATSARRPKLKLAITNGRNVARFVAGDLTNTAAANASIPQPYTVSFTLSFPDDAVDKILLNGTGCLIYVTGGRTLVTFAGGGGVIESSALAASTFHSLIAIFDGASSEIYANGTLVGSGVNIGTAASGALTLGTNGGGYYSGDVGEVRVFAGSMNAGDRALLTAYDRSKWGTP